MEEKNRIKALQDYLLEVIGNVTSELNINYIDTSSVGDYSLVRLPVQPEEEKWIVPITINQEVYNLESVKIYSQDQITNLSNIGFFENLERKIKIKNSKKILPLIDGIESIGCLNCGALSMANTNTAVFSIQIKINYREGNING